MSLNPEIWGPHYWFVLHTIALSYPLYPNAITKKKYYNFIQDLPLFIPDSKIAQDFAIILENYPVTPYLDSRPSFHKWMHFIHNKINFIIDKPEINILDASNRYNDFYKPTNISDFENKKLKKRFIYISIIGILAVISLKLISI